ncbi:MAG TPA: hypothetical protein VIL57_02160 [Bacteroidia bacterium]
MQDFFSEQPVITLLITIVLFLILREVFCWYYKINTIVKQQKETNELLNTLIKLQGKNEVENIKPNPTNKNREQSDEK